MMRFGGRLAALTLTTGLAFCLPASGQTVGTCRGMSIGPNTPWVLFDLGSSALRADARPVIADAAAKIKATKAVSVCLAGQTDKLGDKALNAKLAEARSRSVASELIRNGIDAKIITIASNPEAFGNMSFGSRDASEKDRRVSILFR